MTCQISYNAVYDSSDDVKVILCSHTPESGCHEMLPNSVMRLFTNFDSWIFNLRISTVIGSITVVVFILHWYRRHERNFATLIFCSFVTVRIWEWPICNITGHRIQWMQNRRATPCWIASASQIVNLFRVPSRVLARRRLLPCQVRRRVAAWRYLCLWRRPPLLQTELGQHWRLRAQWLRLRFGVTRAPLVVSPLLAPMSPTRVMGNQWPSYEPRSRPWFMDQMTYLRDTDSEYADDAPAPGPAPAEIEEGDIVDALNNLEHSFASAAELAPDIDEQLASIIINILKARMRKLELMVKFVKPANCPNVAPTLVNPVISFRQLPEHVTKKRSVCKSRRSMPCWLLLRQRTISWLTRSAARLCRKVWWPTPSQWSWMRWRFSGKLAMTWTSIVETTWEVNWINPTKGLVRPSLTARRCSTAVSWRRALRIWVNLTG